MIPQIGRRRGLWKHARVSGFGMTSRGSGRWPTEQQAIGADKVLVKKGLKTFTTRHGSCTGQGCRVPTGWEVECRRPWTRRPAGSERQSDSNSKGAAEGE